MTEIPSTAIEAAAKRMAADVGVPWAVLVAQGREAWIGRAEAVLEASGLSAQLQAVQERAHNANAARLAAQERAERAERDLEVVGSERHHFVKQSDGLHLAIILAGNHQRTLETERDQLASQLREAREIVGRSLDAFALDSLADLRPALAALVADAERWLEATQ